MYVQGIKYIKNVFGPKRVTSLKSNMMYEVTDILIDGSK